MTKTIDLTALGEEGLSQLYAQRIEPILRRNETGRKAAMTSYVWRVGLGGLASIALAAGVFYWAGDAWNALLFGAIALGCAHFFAYQPLQSVAIATKSQSLDAIAGAIGCRFDMGGFEPQGLPRFHDLALLPHCDRSSFEDRFAGDRKGCGFAFYDGHLETKVKTKNGSSWKTVFRGQLIAIDFPKKFLGTTVVRRDAGFFNFMQRWSTSLQRVGLGDSRLEKAFEVYSNDQVEARYLIHPVFMERLLALEARFKGKRLRCAFVDGELLVAVEGGDKFEIGSMFRHLDEIERFRSVASDVTELMRLIDAVLTAEQAVLPPTNEAGPA